VPAHLLGIDLGAGSLKVSVVTPEGGVAGEAAVDLTTHAPRPGWAEQDPGDWVRALGAAVPAALQAAARPASDIAGIAVSGGAHIGVLVDDTGRVVRPAILWSDLRSTAEAAELEDEAGAQIVELSLNRVNPTWLLPQLLWLTRHEPDTVRRTARLYLAKDFIRHQLTGTWDTDLSDAVGALLVDARAGHWSPELCAHAGWDAATLPPLAEPTAVVGHVTAAAAASMGLAEGTPVVCGSNDTTVELVAAGALQPGDGTVKLATAGVIYLVTDGPVVRPPVSCYPHLVPGRWYTASGTNSCASAHRWMRDHLVGAADGDGFAAMDAMAATAPLGSRGLLFHPYLNGERAPHWDPYLRADLVGLTFAHGRADIARAVYEGIAFSLRDAMEAAEELGMAYRSFRVIGGGAVSATWRRILCDVLGRPLLVPANGDASFAAALVAGVGIGLFRDVEDAVAQAVRVVDELAPDERAHSAYGELFAIYRDAQQRLADIDHRLHAWSSLADEPA
jgi:xylulokinase